MSDSEPPVLVCAPADAEYATAGTSYDYHCSRCHGRVMVAPSGQQELRNNPAAAIICLRCFRAALEAGEVDREAAVRLAGTVKQVSSEVLSAKPNPWRNRN